MPIYHGVGPEAMRGYSEVPTVWSPGSDVLPTQPQHSVHLRQKEPGRIGRIFRPLIGVAKQVGILFSRNRG